MYDENVCYERALGSGKKAAAERSRVLAFQDRVGGYLKKRSHEACRRGFLKPVKYTDRIGLGTYAPMVGTTGKPIALDPTTQKKAS